MLLRRGGMVSMNPDSKFDYRALFDLSDRVALVVGGGSGIGQAGAEGLAAHGAQVVVADISADDANGVAGRIQTAGGKASAAEEPPEPQEPQEPAGPEDGVEGGVQGGAVENTGLTGSAGGI